MSRAAPLQNFNAEDSTKWGGFSLPHPRHLTPFPGSQDALQERDWGNNITWKAGGKETSGCEKG